MHALKINDGFAQLQNMKKGNKLHIFFSFQPCVSQLGIECDHAQLWSKSSHFKHVSYLN
jgi:hypothetical protein